MWLLIIVMISLNFPTTNVEGSCSYPQPIQMRKLSLREINHLSTSSQLAGGRAGTHVIIKPCCTFASY